MKRLFTALLLIAVLSSSAQNYMQDSVKIRKIFNEALSNGNGYNQLQYLCKKIGNRLSGSPQAVKAVTWGQQEMNSISDKVIMQEVMVPHWERGAKEKAILTIDGKEKRKSRS